MSYDVYLEIDTGAPDPVEVWWRNHTSNTARMWSDAGLDLNAFNGKSAVLLQFAAANALVEITSNLDKYRAMEPDNGWGTVESTIEFIDSIVDACALHWRATVRVSW